MKNIINPNMTPSSIEEKSLKKIANIIATAMDEKESKPASSLITATNKISTLISKSRKEVYEQGARAMHDYLYKDTPWDYMCEGAVKVVVDEFLSKQKEGK